MWYILVKNDCVQLVSGSMVLLVSRMARHNEEHMIEVFQDNDEDSHLFDLREFDGERNSFCEKLKRTTHSRSLFVKVFNHLRGTVDSKSSSSNGESSTCSSQKRLHQATKTADRTNSNDNITGDALVNEKKQKKKQTEIKTTGRTRQYQSDMRVIGDCIDVHISNLIEPSPRRLVRPVDSEHVQFLTEEFKSNSTSFVILAGFVEDDCDIPCLKEPDCGTEVEVIGGNHSRIALQYLLASGHLTEETVRVKLYSGLTDDEALGVGVLHNSQAQKSKKMTFMDVSRLIRDKLKDCPQEDMLKEKQKLVKIFGLKNVTAFNHNYKASLALATKATEKIWTLAQTLEKKWRAGDIKGGKKGDELKQTIIHDLYSRNLKDEDREVLLDYIINKGRPAFRKLLLELSEKNNKADNGELSEGAENTAEVSTGNQQMADDTDEQENVNTPETDEIEKNELLRKIQELQEENEKLKKENEELKQVVKDLRGNSSQEVTDQQQTATDQQQVFCSGLNLIGKRVLQETNVENQKPTKKSKPIILDDGFTVGEQVMAIWSKDGNEYDATVVKKHNNDEYTVKFYDGVREKRKRVHMRPKF